MLSEKELHSYIAMRKWILSVLAIIFLVAQSWATDLYDQIVKYIKDLNTKELSSLFDQTVEIIIEDREGYYGKTQAEIIIRNFLIKNRPSNFIIVHKGNPNDGLTYSIGLLTTEDGNKYRTYFLMKQKSGKPCIQQLKFELE